MSEEATVEDQAAAEDGAASEEQAGGEEKQEEKAEEGAEDTKSADMDWLESIEDGKAREFASKHTSPADLATAALKMRQKLSNAVNVPGKKASADEIAEYRKKTGVPDEPSGYKVAIPDDLPDEVKNLDEAGQARMDGYLKSMHEAGATPSVVQAGVDSYYAMIAGEIKARTEAEKVYVEEAEAGLRKEWGKDYKGNVAMAERAMEHKDFDSDGKFKEFLEVAEVDGQLLKNNPSFVRFMAVLGRRVAEDKGHIEFRTPEETADLQHKLAEKTSERHDAKAEGKTSKAERLQEEIMEISRQISGKGPVVGQEGRAT